MAIVWGKVVGQFFSTLKAKALGVRKALVPPDIAIPKLSWWKGLIKDEWGRFIPTKALSEWSVIEKKRIDDWRRVWVKIEETVLGVRPDFERLYSGRVVIRDVENRLHVKYFNQSYGHAWDYELEKRQLSDIVRDVRNMKKTPIDYEKYIVFKEYFEYSLRPPRKR